MVGNCPVVADAALYLVLCGAAIWFAAHSPIDQRRDAVTVAGALLANWLFCAWTYVAPASVQELAPDLWAVADMAVGALAVMLAWRHWWGWAIYGLVMAQECFHAARGVVGVDAYLTALDRLLLAMIACFIVLGGRGVAQRVSAWLHRVSDFRRVGSLARVAPEDAR